MRNELEARIQQEIFMYFNNTYCLKNHNPRYIIHSVPNGLPMQLPPKDHARCLDLLHKTGMVNGISDLYIIIPNGKYISVEVKTATGVQSEDQKEIQKRVEDLGGVYLLVRSLLDFQLQIKPHL